MLKLVFRVECKRGWGPYRCVLGWEHRDLTTEQRETYFFNGDGQHPGIMQDLGVYEEENLVPYYPHKESWVCGFDSLEQYADWFDIPEIQKALRANNFLIGQYLVKSQNIRQGKRQILFNRRASRCLAYRRCDDLTAQAKNVSPHDVDKILPSLWSGSILR